MGFVRSNLMMEWERTMEDRIELGDVIKMKKPHPCGTNEWSVLRTGMDFRLKCLGCDHQVMVPRKLVEKNFRGFIRRADTKTIDQAECIV